MAELVSSDTSTSRIVCSLKCVQIIPTRFLLLHHMALTRPLQLSQVCAIIDAEIAFLLWCCVDVSRKLLVYLR